MNSPKASVEKVDNNSRPIETEILCYSEEHKGYKMDSNLQSILAFFGDGEDVLNTALMNFEKIKNKYSFDKKIISFSNADLYYNNVFKGGLIYGYNRKSDQINLMPYGIYSFTTFEGFYPGFVPISTNLDEYVKFENSEVETLQQTVIKFFKNKAIYDENKVRHKGASLLYGAPGCGKTTAIMNLINSSEFKDIYVIFIPKHMSFKSIEGFKEAFEGHHTLIIMEEMTERLGNGTEDILNFLDGYASWNNCYVIATTNYPEILPANLVDRPGRFNNLVEIKMPTDEQKIHYFNTKGFTAEDIASVLPKTKNFSLDYIAQLALQSKLQKLPLDQCLTLFEENKKKVKNTFKGKSNIGIV